MPKVRSFHNSLLTALLLSSFLFYTGTLKTFGQQPHFEQLNIPDLSVTDKINTLVQGKDDFLYVGSNKGLFRFDGITFERIPEKGQYSVITAICPIPGGGLICGTDDGRLLQFTGDSLKERRLNRSIAVQSRISGIGVLNDGSLLIATYGEGLIHSGVSGDIHINATQGLPDDYIYCMEIPETGSIFLGTDLGLIHVKHGKTGFNFTLFDQDRGLPDNIIRSLNQLDKDRLLIGMQSKGVAVFNLREASFSVPKISTSWDLGPVQNSISSGGVSWIATSRRGLVRVETEGEESLQVYNADAKLDRQSLTALLEDREGNIWVGGSGSNLYRMNRQFTFIRSHEEVSFKNVVAITGDSRSNIWFSNSDGLFHHSIVFNGNHTIDKPLDGTPYAGHQVISLFEDRAGMIWAGTFDRGVLRIDPETREITVINRASGLFDNNVIDITQRENEIWLITLGGVSRVIFDASGDPQITNFGKKDGLGNSYFFDVLTDSRNRLWFATDGSGLTMYDGAFHNFVDEMDSQARVVYSIVEDKNGNIWFNTPGSGLYTYNGKRFSRFVSNQTAISRNTIGLAVDRDGDIVSVHSNGVDVIDVGNRRVTHFGSAFGIGAIDPQIKAIASDGSGNIWIGSEDGIILFESAHKRSDLAPTTKLISGELFLLKQSWEKLRRLRHRQNHLTFRYTGLWFQNPEDVLYRYKLEGYDRDWINTIDRSVTFSALPWGKYIFRVQSGIGGVFDPAGEQNFEFTIAPPFWANRWFVFLGSISILAGLVLAIHFREQRLRRRELTRQQEISFRLETLTSQVNPHFLFNSFNTLLHLIESDVESSKEYVENLSRFFRNILEFRDTRLIELSKELELVRNYITLQTKRFGALLLVHFEIPDSSVQTLIPPLTLQILLENAIKHNVIARDQPLEVRIFIEGQVLCVENPIREKRTKMEGTGLGLENIRKRFALLSKQEVTVFNDGKVFRVCMPLMREEYAGTVD